MKKYIVALAVLVLMISAANIASATTIEPPLTGLAPQAGESEFLSYFPPNSNLIAHVDWMVLNPGNYADGPYNNLVSGITGGSSLNNYLYLYQIEARGEGNYQALTNIYGMTIYFDPILVTGFGSYNQSLDIWHNANNFPILATEGEPSNPKLEGVHFGPWISPGSSITWEYDGYLNGRGTGSNQSVTEWLTSDQRPKYVSAGVNGNAQTGGNVPAPFVPEPSSMILLGVGLVGLAGRVVRKKFMA